MMVRQAIYRDQCSACHGIDGKGVPSCSRRWPRRPRCGRPIRPRTDPRRAARRAQRRDRSGADRAGMPAFGWQLKDDQIAAVLTYIRNSWGGAAAAVSADDVRNAQGSCRSRRLEGRTGELKETPMKALILGAALLIAAVPAAFAQNQPTTNNATSPGSINHAGRNVPGYRWGRKPASGARRPGAHRRPLALLRAGDPDQPAVPLQDHGVLQEGGGQQQSRLRHQSAHGGRRGAAALAPGFAAGES